MSKSQCGVNGMNTKKFGNDPVIVIGMHRSGTTLLSRLLEQMGVYLGADLCRETNESFTFMELNDELLSGAEANWHTPMPMRQVLNDTRRLDLLAAEVRNRISKGKLINYWEENTPNSELPGTWGWKDPRNTVTLPIWLRIFPEAKIIHIVRNGIDAAHSLITRNRRETESRIGDLKNKVLQFVTPYRFENAPYQTVKNPSINLDVAFEMWADYLHFADINTGDIPDGQILRLRYEDLLIEPILYLTKILNFVDIRAEDSRLAEVATAINSNRRFNFRNDPELCEFYRRRAKHPLMVKYGYDQLLEKNNRS